MKKIDYKDKDKAELVREIGETQEKLRVFRFSGSGSKSKNVKEGMSLRKNIARMKTALRNVKA